MKKKIVYVASRVRGNLQQNLSHAKVYCKFAISQGVVPIVPHLMYDGTLDDDIPEERETGMKLGIELLKQCDELWAFCDEEGPSEGMKQEIAIAEELNIPVRYFGKDQLCTDVMD